jgi:phosphate transport system substrate-binding protein
MGEDGYLPDRGLIPLGDDALKQVQSEVRTLQRLEM